MEPCGTPVDKEKILEETPSISTYCYIRYCYATGVNHKQPTKMHTIG